MIAGSTGRGSGLLLTLAFCLIEHAAGATSEADTDWNGKFTLGGSLAVGSVNSVGATLDGVLKRKWNLNELGFDLLVAWGESDGTTTASRASLEGDYKRFISESAFWTTQAEVSRDGVAHISYRVVIDAGLGNRFWEAGAKDHFDATGGLGYRREAYSSNTAGSSRSRDDALALVGFDLHKKLGESAESFLEATAYLPMNDPPGWFVGGSAGLSIPVSDSWHFQNLLEAEYLNAPAAGAKKARLLYTIGLGYSF